MAKTITRKSRPYQKDWVDKTLTAAAFIVEVQAAELAPVDMGKLKGSISHVSHTSRSNKKDGISGTAASGEAFVGSNVEYAPYIEYGTRPHFPPLEPIRDWAKRVLGKPWLAFLIARKISRKGTTKQPFLRPAIDTTRRDIKGLIAKHWKEEAFGREYNKSSNL